MYAALAADDGIWHGNLDAADWLFIIATLLFLVAAALSIPRTVHTTTTTTGDHAHHVDAVGSARAWTWPVAFLALAALSFGWALL